MSGLTGDDFVSGWPLVVFFSQVCPTHQMKFFCFTKCHVLDIMFFFHKLTDSGYWLMAIHFHAIMNIFGDNVSNWLCILKWTSFRFLSADFLLFICFSLIWWLFAKICSSNALKKKKTCIYVYVAIQISNENFCDLQLVDFLCVFW